MGGTFSGCLGFSEGGQGQPCILPLGAGPIRSRNDWDAPGAAERADLSRPIRNQNGQKRRPPAGERGIRTFVEFAWADAENLCGAMVFRFLDKPFSEYIFKEETIFCRRFAALDARNPCGQYVSPRVQRRRGPPVQDLEQRQAN